MFQKYLPRFDAIPMHQAGGLYDRMRGCFYGSNAAFLPHIWPKLQEEFEMARGKGRSVGKAQANSGYTEFVNYAMPQDAIDKVGEEFPDVDSITQGVTALLEAGYRIGFSYDFQRQNYICSLTCRNAESVNEGKTLTSFADNWIDALRATLYKHFILLEMDWLKAQSDGNRPRMG